MWASCTLVALELSVSQQCSKLKQEGAHHVILYPRAAHSQQLEGFQGTGGRNYGICGGYGGDDVLHHASSQLPGHALCVDMHSSESKELPPCNLTLAGASGLLQALSTKRVAYRTVNHVHAAWQPAYLIHFPQQEATASHRICGHQQLAWRNDRPMHTCYTSITLNCSLP